MPITNQGSSDYVECKTEENNGVACSARPKRQKTRNDSCSVPLLKNSIGRVQLLPDQYNDSVIDTIEKDGSKLELRETLVYHRKKFKSVGKLPTSELKVDELGEIGCDTKVVSNSIIYVEENMNAFYRSEYNISDDVVLAKSSRKSSTHELDVEKVGDVSGNTKMSSNTSNCMEKTRNTFYRPDEFTSLEVEKVGDMVSNSSNSVELKRSDFYRPEDFDLGDVIWAKSGKKYPAWPGIVIDPILEAPEIVRRACVAGAICVMYFGYSKNGTQRDYAWVRDGLIFPFSEYLDRFSKQTKLYGSKPNEFERAIEEGYLVENGYIDAKFEIGQLSQKDTCPHAQDCSGSCDGCGLTLLCKQTNKKKGYTCQLSSSLCKPCAKLYKLKQYCGVCKKTWHLSGGGNWVRCGDCSVWVHAECANISARNFKNIKDTSYYCPECKAKSAHSPAVPRPCVPKASSSENIQQITLPDKIPVVCTGVEGTYFRSLHLVQCNCGSCGTRQQTLSEWERHTGSRAKKWKVSIKVKDSMLPLSKWLEDYNVHGFNPLKLDTQQLHSFLQGIYEPVDARWTTERCAVCRRDVDWDYDKIIICSRCGMAVHQDCYGTKHVVDYTEWVCRSCETPEVERECCLCPVKGGALKPGDVDNLWVHVTCAWFRPEVDFADSKKMEPAHGLLTIPSNSFAKACIICKQIHGSCIQCFRCDTNFHIMCAARAGYRMELHCSNKTNDTKGRVYCAVHRVPNRDNSIIMHTPKGQFSTRNLRQNQNQVHCSRGSRVVYSKRIQLSNTSSMMSHQSEPLSAARCRVFERSNNKHNVSKPLIHRLMGLRHHSLDAIEGLNSYRGKDSSDYSPFKEQLKELHITEKYHVCFGKSGIHGWGLFARRSIREGKMIMEYRGEKVRRTVSDVRETRYHQEGKDCYFFKLSEELLVDATNKGNIARLLNHSCMPNCCGRITMVGDKDGRLCIVAKTDVAVGDELTFDYMFEPDDEDHLKVPCLCGAPNCRKFIN